MEQIEPGDFVYQSDQELFLVVVEEKENSYLFAAHGWRDIGKDRIEGYVDDPRSKLHRQEDIKQLIEDKGDDETMEQFNNLKKLFETYEDLDLDDGGMSSKFALEE